ncbi:LytR/AlgR family response regulator transcription factor [Dyella flagellata]|uniref:DNA-binding response regulator n=1 Tax=Dyella flagellata TaxID=1867833 RepID=A0ABQ5XBP7_9GAMM|nr:response regulator [Dyella flagellata]GLQ89084.1 DNA-binding response regulator [Dyella flagellata]
MMTIRVLVVDDEPLARIGVVTRLAAYSDMIVVGECDTGEEALRAIPRLAPDLVFLDIEMPGITGIELVRLMPKGCASHFVFLTAHDEYALSAFDIEALDYLLKPIDNERFASCIDRVRRTVSLHRQEGQYGLLYEELIAKHTGTDNQPIRRFTVRRGNDITFVKTDDVDWIEGLADYAGLHVQSKTHLIRETLNSLESHLDSSQFLRIHRSSIVQVDRIVRVQALANRDALVTLRDGQTLRASRNYSAGLHDLLRNRRSLR